MGLGHLQNLEGNLFQMGAGQRHQGLGRQVMGPLRPDAFQILVYLKIRHKETSLPRVPAVSHRHAWQGEYANYLLMAAWHSAIFSRVSL